MDSEYKAVPYSCFYFSKSEDQCSEEMKQTAKDALENELCHFHTMKKNASGLYRLMGMLSSRGTVPFLLELHLRRVFSSLYFLNTTLREECLKILQTE